MATLICYRDGKQVKSLGLQFEEPQVNFSLYYREMLILTIFLEVELTPLGHRPIFRLVPAEEAWILQKDQHHLYGCPPPHRIWDASVTVDMYQTSVGLNFPFPIIRASISDIFGEVYAFVVEVRPRSYRLVWADWVGEDQIQNYLTSGRQRDVRQDCDTIKKLPQDHGWIFERIVWIHIARSCGFVAVQFTIGLETREFVLWRTYLRKMVGTTRADQLMSDYLGDLDRRAHLTILGLPVEVLNLVVLHLDYCSRQCLLRTCRQLYEILYDTQFRTLRCSFQESRPFVGRRTFPEPVYELSTVLAKIKNPVHVVNLHLLSDACHPKVPHRQNLLQAVHELLYRAVNLQAVRVDGLDINVVVPRLAQCRYLQTLKLDGLEEDASLDGVLPVLEHLHISSGSLRESYMPRIDCTKMPKLATLTLSGQLRVGSDRFVGCSRSLEHLNLFGVLTGHGPAPVLMAFRSTLKTIRSSMEINWCFKDEVEFTELQVLHMQAYNDLYSPVQGVKFPKLSDIVIQHHNSQPPFAGLENPIRKTVERLTVTRSSPSLSDQTGEEIPSRESDGYQRGLLDPESLDGQWRQGDLQREREQALFEEDTVVYLHTAELETLVSAERLRHLTMKGYICPTEWSRRLQERSMNVCHISEHPVSGAIEDLIVTWDDGL